MTWGFSFLLCLEVPSARPGVAFGGLGERERSTSLGQAEDKGLFPGVRVCAAALGACRDVVLPGDGRGRSKCPAVHPDGWSVGRCGSLSGLSRSGERESVGWRVPDIQQCLKVKALVARTSAIVPTRDAEVEPVAVRVVDLMVRSVAERMNRDREEAIHLVLPEAVGGTIAAVTEPGRETSACVGLDRPSTLSI